MVVNYRMGYFFTMHWAIGNGDVSLVDGDISTQVWHRRFEKHFYFCFCKVSRKESSISLAMISQKHNYMGAIIHHRKAQMLAIATDALTNRIGISVYVDNW